MNLKEQKSSEIPKDISGLLVSWEITTLFPSQTLYKKNESNKNIAFIFGA
ncbi:hypothetical protein [Flexithrix dorotheae]|nr:hypothetical protein [Flexithrix dorotheae]